MLEQPVIDELSPLVHDKLAALPDPTEYRQTSDSRNKALIGSVYILASSISFATVDTYTRIVTSRIKIPPETALFVKAIIYIIVTGIYSYLFVPYRSIIQLSNSQRFALLSYGLIIAVFLLCLFRALEVLPVGDVTAITFTNPAVTIILSYIFLSEPFGVIEMINILTGIIGVYLIAGHSINLSDLFSLISTTNTNPVNDNGNSNDTLTMGYLYAIATCILSAVSFLANRRIGSVISPIFVVFVLAWFILILSCATGGAVTIPQLFEYGSRGVAIIVICSLVGIVLTSFIIKGFQLCPPGPGAILHTLTVPLTYIEGALLLGEQPMLQQSIGALLVVSGTAITGIDLIRKTRTSNKSIINDEDCKV